MQSSCSNRLPTDGPYQGWKHVLLSPVHFVIHFVLSRMVNLESSVSDKRKGEYTADFK